MIYEYDSTSDDRYHKQQLSLWTRTLIKALKFIIGILTKSSVGWNALNLQIAYICYVFSTTITSISIFCS